MTMVEDDDDVIEQDPHDWRPVVVILAAMGLLAYLIHTITTAPIPGC